MLLKVKRIREGAHPSEVVVAVNTADGTQERLIVDRRSLTSINTLGVGYPVGSESDRLLVELPRETLSGRWRVWVRRDAVVEEAIA